MNESIYTIPVNIIFENNGESGCPICKIRDMLEERCLDYITGAAMMEPDIRITTNEKGFCKDHLFELLSRHKRLQVALMMESHLASIRKKLDKNKIPLVSYKKNGQSKTSCYICESIEHAKQNMYETIIGLYSKERSFRELFSAQDHLCLVHYSELAGYAQEKMDRRWRGEFLTTAKKLSIDYLDTLCADVSKFCTMFDYRNSGENADFGTSRDSLERTAAFLTSRKTK